MYRRICGNSQRSGCRLFDINEGICHQIMAADYINPGDIIIGGDSHTCTGGAVGAFATGMGSTDLGVVLAYGQTWLKVPDTIKFEISGSFQKGVFAKDLILHIIGQIGADGATYKSMEFVGEAVKQMAVHQRLTVSNMAIEAGAKVGLFPSDEQTRRFMAKRDRASDWQEFQPDPDARYESEFRINLDDLVPTLSCPHLVDNTCAVTDERLKNIRIHQAFIGSCTNARLEDLKITADILEKNGCKIHPDVRLIVNPASREVYQAALEQGILMTLAQVRPLILPAAVCAGSHKALADGEVGSAATIKFQIGSATLTHLFI